MDWYITSCENKIGSYAKKYSSNIKSTVFIDGYIVPRLEYYNQFKHYSQENLIHKLYNQYQENFVNYIKGSFVVILFYDTGFKLFSDRHGIRKYFIYRDRKHFFISNSLSIISKKYNLEIDNEQVAVFSLTSHFFNGNTLFKNLETNKSAQYVKLSNGQFEIKYYWSPREIKNRRILKQTTQFYANKWKQIINSYIDFLEPKNISLTLTGGNDSRLVLSALLSLKRKFHSFTFGNPKSYDGVISSIIKDRIKLKHHFHHVENPTRYWFENHAQDIIEYGHGLINIHRSHRNDAIKSELEQEPNIEMIITGLVGGEYFKETYFDDVSIPKIFEVILKNPKVECIHILSKELIQKGVNIDTINLEKVYEIIKVFLDNGKSLKPKEMKFVYTFLFYGCSHHSQDSNVFAKNIKYVVNPFMDIDFIEIMINHSNWYGNKKSNFFNRFFHSEFFISITHYLASELSDIPYAKKGSYTANDIVNNKMKYLIKRLSYLITNDRDTYPPNFPMGEWLYHFCVDELERFLPKMKALHNYNHLANLLIQAKNKKTEKSWHPLTNPINLNLIYERYKKN